jgi:hypothetical protein
LNSNEKKEKGNNDFENNILKEIKEIHNYLNPLFLTNIEFLDVLKLCREEAKNSEENEKKKIIKEKGKSIFL